MAERAGVGRCDLAKKRRSIVDAEGVFIQSWAADFVGAVFSSRS